MLKSFVQIVSLMSQARFPRTASHTHSPITSHTHPTHATPTHYEGVIEPIDVEGVWEEVPDFVAENGGR